MQIEKINKNKLKVILNTSDLEENNIDLNNFMANSLESQELFLDILDLAEEKFNFYVHDSKLVIESISLANNIFIFTITLNIINIINNPYLLNGLILEINIGIIIFCLYSWIKLQQRVNILKEKELDIKIRTILKNLE